MLIRKYKPEDCRTLSRLFYHTVHTVNAKDYSQEQLKAWATGEVDLEKWNQSFLGHHTFVAVETTADQERILGFGDIDDSGYLDRLYVHKDYRGRGIGRSLMENVLAYAAECEEIDTVISLITSENAASIHLHEVYGFEYCGQIKNAGTKFGRKLSLNAYQILYDR